MKNINQGKIAVRAGFTVAILTMAFLWTCNVRAADDTWTSTGNGFWTNAANWSGGVPDATFVTTYISNATTKTVTLDGAGVVSNLTIRAPSGTTNTLDLVAGSSLQASGITAIGAGPGFAQMKSESVSAFTSTDVTAGFSGTTAGTGAWTINGGTNTLSGNLTIGNGNVIGTTGSVVLAGGYLNLGGAGGGTVQVGARRDGKATFTMSGGSLLAGSVSVGVNSSADGRWDVSGGTASLQDLHLGDINTGSTGIVVMTGGSIYVTNGLNSGTHLGLGRAGFGELTISNGLLQTVNEFVGYQRSATIAGNGKLTIVGGTNLVTFVSGTHTKIVSVGSLNAGSTGDVVVTGTGLLDARTMTDVEVGTLSVGSLTVAGGGQVVLGNLIVGADVATASGTINLTGGSLFVTNSAGAATNDLRANSSFTIQSPAIAMFDKFLSTNSTSSITFNGGTLSARQMTISNNAALVVGDGTQTAKLNLLGGSHSFANGLTLNTNSTLGGDGFSTMTLGGDLNLLSNSTFVVDLMTNTTTGFDRAFVTGGVSLAESIFSLRITNYNPVVGTQFKIIDNDGTGDSVSGFFHGLPNNALIDASAGGQDIFFRILYNGGDGNDVVLLASVPEPNSALLLSIALGVLGITRRRRS